MPYLTNYSIIPFKNRNKIQKYINIKSKSIKFFALIFNFSFLKNIASNIKEKKSKLFKIHCGIRLFNKVRFLL